METVRVIIESDRGLSTIQLNKVLVNAERMTRDELADEIVNLIMAHKAFTDVVEE